MKFSRLFPVLASVVLCSIPAHAEQATPNPPGESLLESNPAESALEGDPIPPPVLSPEMAETEQESRKPWFRNAAEYLASRSVRKTFATDVNTKIITDGKRFDTSLGKRIALYRWAQESLSHGWSLGIDGGMLASLTRYSNRGKLAFATNTFDGMFGFFIGFTTDEGWLALFRSGHLSAHLVDNSPQILNTINYSQFWNEIYIGKTFPAAREQSDWDLHLQGSVGLNHTSTPRAEQPRATLGIDLGYALFGPDSLGLLASADALRAGVSGQKNTYAFFLGMGFLSRPQTTHRPFRFGVAHFQGSDYRNQFYDSRQKWTTFEIAAEL